MAQAAFGAEYTRFAPFKAKESKEAAPTYDEIISLGGLVSVTETPNVASGKLDSDNKETLRKDSMTSYAIAMTTDGLSNKDAATFYGASYDETTEELGRDPDDKPPLGGFGYIRNIATEEGEYYKGYFYPKVKAVPTADGATTKGDNVTYSTTNVNMTALKAMHRSTKIRVESKNFDTFEEAVAWLDTKLGKPIESGG